MNWLGYCLPGGYTFSSRLPGALNKVGWVARFVIPQLWLLVIALDGSFRLAILGFLALWVPLISIYEVGYIVNDFITVKHEPNPTIRLATDRREWLSSRLLAVIFIKLGIAVSTTLGVALLTKLSPVRTYPLQFLFVLGAVCVAFYFHNSVRSRLNILTYSMLASCKYLAIPSMMFSFRADWNWILAIWLMFPACRILEHAAKPKYGLHWLGGIRRGTDWYRVNYYLVLSLLFSIGFIFGRSSWWGWASAMCAYLLLIRIASLILRGKNVQQPQSG